MALVTVPKYRVLRQKSNKHGFQTNIGKEEAMKTDWTLNTNERALDGAPYEIKIEIAGNSNDNFPLKRIEKLNDKTESSVVKSLKNVKSPRVVKKKQIEDEKRKEKEIASKNKQVGTDQKSKDRKIEVKTADALELDKQRHNIQLILDNSNATPIRAHYVGNGYGCCFCNKFFIKAADLKHHTIHDHDMNDKMKHLQHTSLRGLVNMFLKLDITGLKCICETELETIDDLYTHLKDVHDETVHAGMKCYVVSFKLDNEEFKCLFCQFRFSTFRKLLGHMNVHYRNFICTVCDAGFVNKHMMLGHTEIHTKGRFECDICKKVFDMFRSVKHHIKTSHSVMGRHKCFQCGKKFRTLRIKKEHIVKVHGVQFDKLNCSACDRSFRDLHALRIHTRRDHLMERRFKCTECEKAFFTTILLQNHMVSHTGSRDFKCEICGKCFGTKKYRTAHMRNIHSQKTDA